jgi:hypothetical protein
MVSKESILQDLSTTIQEEGWKKEESLFGNIMVKYSKINRNHQPSYLYVCNLMKTATTPCGYSVKRLERAKIHVNIKGKHFMPVDEEDLISSYKSTKLKTSKIYLVKFTN